MSQLIVPVQKSKSLTDPFFHIFDSICGILILGPALHLAGEGTAGAEFLQCGVGKSAEIFRSYAIFPPESPEFQCPLLYTAVRSPEGAVIIGAVITGVKTGDPVQAELGLSHLNGFY